MSLCKIINIVALRYHLPMLFALHTIIGQQDFIFLNKKITSKNNNNS